MQGSKHDLVHRGRHVVNPVLEGLGQGEFIVWEEITAILGPYKVD